MNKWLWFSAGIGVGIIVLCALSCIVQVSENCFKSETEVESCQCRGEGYE